MSPSIPPGYLHTEGSHILDENNNPVRLAGVNWYGIDCSPLIVGGLDRRPIDEISKQIADLGFNCIRLPFCVQAVLTNPAISRYLDAEPGLQGKTALEILDAVVQSAGRNNLKIILDCHRGPAGWSTQENGLWYTRDYPETAWMQAWENLARRYAEDSTVIGCDLHNEPGSPPSQAGYWPSNGGSLWGFGDGFFGGSRRDWAAAATRAGNEILAVNPNLLIFVEGVREDPAGPSENNNSYWFGGNLTGVGQGGGRRHGPVSIGLKVANRLVYSVHDYGPDNYAGLPWCQFGSTANSPDACFAVWDKTWGFIVDQEIAPVWLGEFGTPNGLKPNRPDPPETYTHPNASNPQGAWFSYLMQYVNRHDLHWTYWCINGTQSEAPKRTPGYVEWYGILDPSWTHVASQPLMDLLAANQ